MIDLVCNINKFKIFSNELKWGIIAFLTKNLELELEPEENPLEKLFSKIIHYQYEARNRSFYKKDFESLMEIAAKIYDMGNENDRKRLLHEIEICEIDYKIGILLREANQQRRNICMKFTCDRDIMRKEIAIVVNELKHYYSFSLLSNIYLEAKDGTLLIKAMETTFYFTARIPVNIVEPGSTIVFGEKFLHIIDTMPEGELEIEYSDKKTSIRHYTLRTKIQYQLNNLIPNFPQFPMLTEGYIFNFQSRDFKEMIARTVFAVSDDETKYYMNGIFFDQIISKTNDKTLLAMIGSDGRRLAYAEKETASAIPDFKGVIIKPRILNLFTKLVKDEEGPVLLCFAGGFITLSFDSYELSETLIDGTFPNYRRVIPETQKHSCSFDRSVLLDTFKSLSSGVPGRICLRFTPGTLSVYSTYSRNEEWHITKEPRKTLSCAYEGEELNLCMDVWKLKESLEHLSEDRIQFCFTGTDKPVTIKPEVANGSFQLIMPMQGI